MFTEEQFEQLRKENDEYKFEINDLKYMLQLREEELQSMYTAVSRVSELQSRLDQNLLAIEQLNSLLEEHRRQIESAIQRESSLESEILESIKLQKSFNELKEKYVTSQNTLSDVYLQMNELSALYGQVAELKSRISELESNLEITNLDNRYLKKSLDIQRKAAETPFTPTETD